MNSVRLFPCVAVETAVPVQDPTSKGWWVSTPAGSQLWARYIEHFWARGDGAALDYVRRYVAWDDPVHEILIVRDVPLRSDDGTADYTVWQR